MGTCPCCVYEEALMSTDAVWGTPVEDAEPHEPANLAEEYERLCRERAPYVVDADPSGVLEGA
jgi:hypothetical protein